MDNRNMQVARIFQVLAILQSSRNGKSVTEIEAALIDRGFEVQKRTVYRDIDALETAGFPINRDDGTLLPLANTPFHNDLMGLFKKIDDKLGSNSRDHLDEIREGFKFDPGPRWGLGMDPDTIDTLRAGCAERQILVGVYASASSGTVKDRRIGPHYLYFAKGALYLVGEDLDDSKVKVFSAPRFKSVAMTDEVYTGSITTPEEYFQGAFGMYKDGSDAVEVIITFNKQIAPYVRERKWHSSQTVVNKADGSIVMTLHCQVNLELVRWVLGFGANARAISPDSLVKSVQEESKNVAKIYG